jgi:hypothetical protein
MPFNVEEIGARTLRDLNPSHRQGAR